ncbi:MauE/DoxX family redox-associated membrane protein [Xanthovirga aplysinae]|uniref:MauE/DoxX family redox-associated membrane protein n=1 Tax=Xanthovirga aplysinae TaxID=2529853 RepID=UPI0012BD447B|nr:MauE/DoxX family redox-associated membrane protein [Xanthovirga aplysinae]MTI32463.1 DoxX family membrane protein [Xanthovirga aplysinae]
MITTTYKYELQWSSLLLRIAIGSLFLAAGIIKLPNGISGNIAYYQQSYFEHSLLPDFFITSHASIIMFVEFILAIWLFSGYRLKWAWIGSGLTFISLAFGLVFAYQFASTNDNYIYLFITTVGLLLSRHDYWVLGKPSN